MVMLSSYCCSHLDTNDDVTWYYIHNLSLFTCSVWLFSTMDSRDVLKVAPFYAMVGDEISKLKLKTVKASQK